MNKAVGKPLARVDAPAKATGRARYTDDFYRPDMLLAKCFRSTIAHGRVTAIDVSAAKNLPGVVAVFTFEDVPEIPFATAGHPFSLNPEERDVADRHLLTQNIRFYGDEIAVVVAENEAAVDSALQAIQVQYERYTPLLSPDEILAPGAREIHETSQNIAGQHAFECGGDVQKALAKADVLTEGQFKTQLVQQAHLENHAVFAYMDDLDRISIVTATQVPQIVRRIVAQALGIPWGRIRVIRPHVGGGFGNKQDAVYEPLAAFLTLRLRGRPVRITLSRDECMICTRNRHPFYIDITSAFDKSGILTANHIRTISITGGYASHGHAVSRAGSAKICSLYPRAATAYSGRTLYANTPVAGAMRGYGTPQIIFAIECNMEDAARKTGMDPVDFRLQNVAREGDTNPLTRQRLLTCGIADCLIRGKELIGWGKKIKEYAHFKSGPLRKGLGVACFSYASGTYPACVEIAGARLILNPDGSVALHVGSVEIGQGSDTIAVQMAAETIGIPCDQIHLNTLYDTDMAPFDSGAYASRQAYVQGNALCRAAMDFKSRILSHAAVMSGFSSESLDIQGGNVVRRSHPLEKCLSLKDVALDVCYHKERGGQITTDVSHKTTTNAPCFGCTFVDITVDIHLCRVHINQMVNVHDSGVIINPVTASGQVEGGAAMGIGAALYEELLMDNQTGKVQNANLSEYKIPTALDVPSLKCAFVETAEPTSGYGNKGLGEPPVITPPPAIRNAILDATDVALYELPMTPQVLFKHFKKSGLI